MTNLGELSQALSRIDYDTFSDENRFFLKRHVLDTVGASIAGRRSSEGSLIEAFYDGEASVDAVSRGSAVTRLTEIDDIDIRSCTTPGSVVVPTGLTLAGMIEGLPVARLYSALAAGYAAMVHLGRMIDGAAILYRGVWPTLFCAPVAAAAVAARLRGLPPETLANALAIALGLSGGRPGHGGPGPAARWLMVGEAARLGVTAARAAEAGFVGDPKILDGPWLRHAHGIVPMDPEPFDAVTKASVLSELSIKPYCSAKQLTSALLAFQGLLTDGIDPRAIEAIEVAVPPRYAAMIDHGAIEGDRLSGIASAPFTLALAAFQPEGLYDVDRTGLTLPPEAQALMDRVSVTPDEALDRFFPEAWPARVTVRTNTGGTTREVTVAKGDPGDPVDHDEIVAKFARIAGPAAATLWPELIFGSNAEDDAAPICSRYAAIFEK